jgi:glycosyltransferase involved in cell wall biosynthesis
LELLEHEKIKPIENLPKQSTDRIKVIHFQRKPRPGFNYSIESVFKDLRCNLKDRIDFTVAISSWFNTGYFSKILNMLEAAFRQKKNAISHITGEVYFLNLFMLKETSLLTIHDCRFMQRKKGIEKKIMQWLYLKAPVKNAAYIVTVSETTKKEVMNYTGCNPHKIQVIPVSVSNLFQPVYKVFNKDCPVILQVGAAENKNLLRLAEALDGICCRLVIIGTPGKREIEKLALANINYLIKAGLTTAALYEEYIACDIVSFVSTFEGFGMPIIEANCVERAVLTSNISSMPEVAGNAACLVDSFDVNDIRKGVLRLIQDDEYRDALIANGRTNKLRFNGQIIADKYYELYKKIAAKSE